MDAAYLSALSALAGSVVGGLTTALSAWITQCVSAKAGLVFSHLVSRVMGTEDRVLQFDASVFGGELPVGRDAFLVSVSGPCLRLGGQRADVRDSPVGALP